MVRFKLHTKNAAFVVGLFFVGTHSFKIECKSTTLFQHTQIILKIWSVYLKNSKSFLKQMVTDEQKMLKLRIRHLLDTMKTSIRTLADTESERVMLGRQINGEDTIVSFQTIYKLLNMFPSVSADWLVMGEGGMYKSEHIAPHVFTQHNEVHGNRAGGDITVGSGTQVMPSAQKFEELQARVAELEHDKRTLQAVVDAMTAGARRK